MIFDTLEHALRYTRLSDSLPVALKYLLETDLASFRRRALEMTTIQFERIAAEKEKELHDWQQPGAIIEELIKNFSDPGNLICDPCGGGFTTALACRSLSLSAAA